MFCMLVLALPPALSNVLGSAVSYVLGYLLHRRFTFRSSVAHRRGLPSWLLVTAIGGQGHIIGRGNQQISPQVLRAIGLEHLRVVATKRKLATLAGRPLLVDSGDPQLDGVFPDAIRVWTGYQEELLYPLGWSAERLAAADEGAEACGNK